MFVNLFEKFRGRAGLTKQNISKRIDVNPSYIVNIMKGNQPPPKFPLTKKIADILNLLDKERLEFYSSAFKERASEDDNAYMEAIGDLSKKTGESVEINSYIISALDEHEIVQRFVKDYLEPLYDKPQDLFLLLKDPLFVKVALEFKLANDEKRELLAELILKASTLPREKIEIMSKFLD